MPLVGTAPLQNSICSSKLAKRAAKRDPGRRSQSRRHSGERSPGRADAVLKVAPCGVAVSRELVQAEKPGVPLKESIEVAVHNG